MQQMMKMMNGKGKKKFMGKMGGFPGIPGM